MYLNTDFLEIFITHRSDNISHRQYIEVPIVTRLRFLTRLIESSTSVGSRLTNLSRG